MTSQEQFVIDYLQQHHFTDVTDQLFHDSFHNFFGGKRKRTNFGAQPVYKAQRLLSSMYKRRLITRDIIGLSGQERGFPKWVYGYSLGDFKK